ncbi:unnamed protein product [marine sediment metagenome]|uniref:Uncharacterized protein n=1 Tax=marine sediment metagenome TaxID=412755 RepID=X0WNZ7_9ZZZZ
MRAWVYDPHSGGIKIPAHMKDRIRERILKYAEKHFSGKYTRIDVRFRGKFCYIDAHTEAFVPDGWPPAGFPESCEEYIKRLRTTPVHLCRLRYSGDEESWSFAVYIYSHEKYEPASFADGNLKGPPEQAFDLAAGLFLQE